MTVTRQTIADFRQALIAAFPDLFDESDEVGPPYLPISQFAAFTQEAKGRADWETYRRCAALVERFFGAADAELENALHVSYLEHLDFEGPRGPEAWRLLGPSLQRAWQRIAASNVRAAALPRKQRKHRS
jgi:hypothetical protein